MLRNALFKPKASILSLASNFLANVKFNGKKDALKVVIQRTRQP